jgi:parallel beta-helix repeat protein
MNGIITSISFLGLLLSTGATPASGPADYAEKVAQVKAGKLQEARADWWGFNETDATACLQKAINSGVKKLTVPNLGKPWIVDPIFLVSDQEIVLEPGAVIEAKKGSFKGIGDALVTSRQKKNIALSGGKGATLRMHKKDYQDKTQYKPAEWRHCVNLGGSENVKVLGLTLASSGGDGVYVNGCKDIVIKDCVIDDNHRQGISVISAVNLLIENCVIKNTQGTSPEAGIDFEPNRKTQRLSDMTVRNCTFENNATAKLRQSRNVAI